MNNLNPRKSHANLLAGLAVALIVSACGGGGGGGDANPDPEVVEVDDPNGLMDALSNKITSGGVPIQLVDNGTSPPAPTADTDPEPLKAEAGVVKATAVPGDTVNLPINLNGSPTLANLFAKVPGADSYFQAPIASGGAKAAVPGKATVNIVTLTTLDFRVVVPDNVEADNGQFCFDFTVEDADGRVTDPVRSCIEVVSTPPPQPDDDQPSIAALDAALQGSWLTGCLDVDDQDADGDGDVDFAAAKLGVSFGSGKSFSQDFAAFADDACTQPSDFFGESGVVSFVFGTYRAGGSNYSAQSGRWLRNFNFTPENAPDTPPQAQFSICYNLLSLNAGRTALFLGVPITFSFNDGSNPVEGDCRAEDTRPDTVITALPFRKQ